MREVCSLIWLALVEAFRSRVSLEAENTILRHQLNVLRRQSPKRPTFGMLDRLIFAGLYRLAPKVLGALAIVKPETVIKWHRGRYPLYPLNCGHATTAPPCRFRATSGLMHRSNQRYSMISSARSPIRGLALNRSAIRSRLAPHPRRQLTSGRIP